MTAQGKNWCFTINNWISLDEENIRSWPYRYYIYGKEEAPETGTPHLQGYVIFNKNFRLAGVKKLSPTAHWELARGSTEQNIVYCSKSGVVEEAGEKPMTKRQLGEQEKERWDTAWNAAKEGRFEDVPSDIKFRFYRAMKDIAKDHMVKPDDAEDVTGVWIYGAAGVGKSRKAREDYPGAYLKMQNKWWDGYQGEDYVILDDFDSKELGHHLKIWADRYSFLAETKGGALHIRPKKFVITSNYGPDDSKFDWDAEMREAIKRRFHVIHMTRPFG